MSLINRMLLDLEDRQSEVHGEPALAGLSSVDYCTSEDRRFQFNRRALLTGAGILLAVLALLRVWPNPELSPSSPRQAPAGVVSGPVVHPFPIPENTPALAPAPAPLLTLQLDDTLFSLARLSAQEPEAAPSEPVAIADGSAVVSGIEIQAREGVEEVNIALTGAVKFNAYPLVNPARVVVEIAGASVPDGISRSLGSGLVQRVRARNERGQAILVLDLTGPAQIQSTMLEAPDGVAQLRLQLAAGDSAGSRYESTADISTPPPVDPAVVEPGQLTRSRRGVDQLFEKGAELYRNGSVAEGLAILTELVAQAPGHVAGRELLATALLQHGDPEQGIAMLDAGLRQFPSTWQWAQLRAQLAVKAGNPEQAHEVLVRALPTRAEQPDYHALLAAVQQRTGRHSEAVNTYHAILALRPDRGLWWMGLGISLQALARDREAGFAFNRALEDVSLTPELRSFVQGRMSSLPPGGDT